MRKILLVIPIFLIVSLILIFILFNKQKVISPLGGKIVEKPLEKYAFKNLQKTIFEESDITLGKVVKQTESFTSQIFYFKSFGKKVSGLINIPKQTGKYPVIVMFRGFVPKEQYQTGVGTQRGGEVFASNGFITLAPDFLGYGESDSPSKDSIEERFQTYTTALTLLASIGNLNKALANQCHAEFISASPKKEILNQSMKQVQDMVQDDKLCNVRVDAEKVGIWGHSNGGHIALSVLAISGKNYPTVLWAPVSKPFPYSILYFTDDFDDHGKALRKVLANFEKDYDAEKYSTSNFYNFIQAPLQMHQGENDDAVPKRWSDELVETLKKLDKDVTYFVYPNSDHNLAPDGWNLAVQRSISFYRLNL